jgi:hypothetical protein
MEQEEYNKILARIKEEQKAINSAFQRSVKKESTRPNRK